MNGLMAFLFTLGGLVIGWALTQASEWIRRKDEYRRMYREVLSYLLDFHHHLQAMSMDIAPTLEQYTQVLMQENVPGLSREQANALSKQFSNAAFEKQMKKMVGPRMAEMKTGYADAVQRLASIDPVLAYSLRNQDDFLQALEHARDIALKLNKLNPQELVAANALFDQVAKPQVLADAATSVRQLIAIVSKKVNRRTSHEAKELVQKQLRLSADRGGASEQVARGIAQFIKDQQAQAGGAEMK